MPHQAANKLTLQTSRGPLTVSVQSGTHVLPPAKTSGMLHLSFHTALTGKTTQANTPLLLNLSWSGRAIKATNLPALKPAAPVTLNTLQGSEMPATTLSHKAIAHLLPKMAAPKLTPSPAVHSSSIRADSAGAASGRASSAGTSSAGTATPVGGRPSTATASATATSATSTATSGAMKTTSNNNPINNIPTPSATALAANQSLNLRIAVIQLPNQTLPPGTTIPVTGPTGMPAIQAAVLASQPGNTIVQTSVGPMSLPISSPLPPGSLLTLLPLTEPIPLQAPIQISTHPATAIHERWAMLQHAISMLQVGNPQAAQQVMKALPKANIQMATSMLFLLSTLRGGALENWLGRHTATRLSPPMAERLLDSVKQNTRQVRDGLGQEWRAFGMPVAQESNLGELWLYLKDKPDEEAPPQDQKDDAKRFIIETSFRKMGPLQLDGLATQKSINLMFRSLIPVEAKMRNDIRAIFANTITALDLTGTIRFHVSDHFPVSMTEESVILGEEVTI